MTRVKDLVLRLMVDPQIEVRTAAAETFSGLIHCDFLSVDIALIDTFRQQANDKSDPIRKHGGVLALSSIVQAYPYSVPNYVPETLMALCYHATELQPIYVSIL